MAVNPINVGVISYNDARAFKLTGGATSFRRGAIVKLTAGLLVPAVDNDENGLFFVSLQEFTTGSGQPVLVVPITDCIFRLAYTGTVPTAPTAIGVAYGITGPITLDFDNVTQILLTVLAVDTNKETVTVTGTNLSI